MNSELMLLPIGTNVLIGEPNNRISATIIKVAISSEIEYLLRWWEGTERKTQWVQDDEVGIVNQDKQPIGFCKPESTPVITFE